MKIKELNVKDYVRKKKERKGKVLKALQNRELFQLKKFLRTSLVSVKVFFPSILMGIFCSRGKWEETDVIVIVGVRVS